MASLTGNNPRNTYKQLLQIGSGNVGLSGSLQRLQDGSGENSALSISTGTVQVHATSVTINGFALTVLGTSSINGTVSGTNTGDQTITLTGDVTGSGTGSFAATIANNAVTTAKILNANVTFAKIQNVTNARLLGNNSGSAAAPSEISIASPLSFSGSTLGLSNTAFINSIVVTRVTTTGAGTYTPTTGMCFAEIEMWGAGGSGGGCAAALGGASGGGGGGGYIKLLATAAQIGASASYSVGTGGAAPSAGGNAGNTGGDTTITISGSTWTAKGGAGSIAGAATQYCTSRGASAANTTGSNATVVMNVQGGNGRSGMAMGGATGQLPGQGGDSFGSFGGIPQGANQQITGVVGFGPGAGGSGSGASTGSAAVAGGAGNNGQIIIKEFIAV